MTPLFQALWRVLVIPNLQKQCYTNPDNHKVSAGSYLLVVSGARRWADSRSKNVENSLKKKGP